MSTNRRSFLKAGALVAAPVVALAAPAALAADPRLTLLEDERAIATTLRGFLARFNTGGLAACDGLCAQPLRIRPQLGKITLDPAAEPIITIEGDRALYQRGVELATQLTFTGDTTLEKMARFQGTMHTNVPVAQSMSAGLDRTADGWKLASLMFH